MARFRLLAIAALAAVMAVGASAQAQTNWTGVSVIDVTDWHDATNWDNGEPNAVTDARFVDKDNITVNLYGTNAVSANLGVWGSTNFTVESDPGVTLTVNILDINTSTGNNSGNNTSNSPTFNVDLIVNDTIQQWRKCGGNHRYNRNVTVTGLVQTRSNSWYFGDGVDDDVLTFNGGLDVTFSSINAGNTVTTTVNGRLVTPTVTVGAFSTLNAVDPNSLGSSATSVTINEGGLVNIQAAQNDLANITVNAFGVLAGDVTNAVYGGGGNVTLVEDAILAITAGPAPTEADLGLTPGVEDALVWQAVTSTGSHSAGDDGNSVYKGLALSAVTPSRLSDSQNYSGLAGKNLTVAVATNATDTYDRADFNADTGVANLKLYGSSAITINNYVFEGTAQEIHIRNQSNSNRTILTLSNNAMDANQAIHAHDGVVALQNNAADNILGRLELHGDSVLTLPSTPIVPDANTVIVLNDNSALSVSTGEEAVLEGMTLGTNLIVSSTRPLIYLENRNGGYDFTGAVSGTPNPVMTDVLLMSDQVLNSNNNNLFELDEDMLIGDGKYLINYTTSHKGISIVDNDANYPGQITAETGASSIGLAMLTTHAGTLKIDVPIDAAGGKVMFGSPTALTGVDQGYVRLTQVPVGTVELNANATFTNTSEVSVESGTLRTNADITFNTDLALNGGTFNVNGRLVTVNGTLRGSGGTWTNGALTVAGTVAPGDGVGTLSGATLEMEDGATYEWELSDATPGGEGTGWDLISAGGNITFLGNLTFRVLDAGLAGDLDGSESFIVARPVGAIDDTLLTVTFDLPGWSGGSLAVVGQDLVLTGLLTSLVGDADDNGVVNAADYIILKSNMGTGTGAGAAAGDFDGDGNVDWNDLQLLQDHYGEGGAGASGTIPEPATLGLLAVGAIAVIRRRQG